MSDKKFRIPRGEYLISKSLPEIKAMSAKDLEKNSNFFLKRLQEKLKPLFSFSGDDLDKMQRLITRVKEVNKDGQQLEMSSDISAMRKQLEEFYGGFIVKSLNESLATVS